MTLRCWDVATAAPRSVWTGHGAPVLSAAVSPSGKWVASGDEAGIVIVWNRRSGRPERKLRAHDGAVTGIAFHGDTHFYTTGGAFSVGGHGSVKAWGVGAKNALDALPIEGGPRCVMLWESTLWVGCQDSTIGRYRLALPE